MKFSVDLTRSAQADLIDIVEWIAGNGSTERALHVLDQLLWVGSDRSKCMKSNGI
jgi:plasmid stabilization system protein ParE